MTRIPKYLAVVAVTAAMAGTPALSYAAAQGTAAHGPVTRTVPLKTVVKTTKRAGARKTAPTPRAVAPGEHVVAAPGFEVWLTPEGKYWKSPFMDEPGFRSVVDGNIDLNTPGVSMQAEVGDGHACLSGIYAGGRTTASRVVVETKAGIVRGRLVQLAGEHRWGAWYATSDASTSDPDFVTQVTVYDTKGKVYARLKP
ncbi:hypothetical protein ACWEO4_05150 [Streptomyces sp. NPDC004393]|uniref:hypothetical protein n=1 Tax=Streptomyces sp. NPDC004533 TaxID=3154278 RepID=UPI0033AE2924